MAGEGSKYLASNYGVSENDGLSMLFETTYYNPGERHGQTATYGSNQSEYLNLSPRDALAADVKDMKRILQEQGLYDDYAKQQLKDYIKQQEQMEYSTTQKYIDDPDYAGKVIENEMIFSKEYEKVYLSKKENTRESIQMINDFCSQSDGKAEVDDIPDLLKLFYDAADTSEQNVFVEEVISSILEKEPEKAIVKIIENIKILEEEHSVGFIYDLVALIIYSPEDYSKLFIQALVNASDEKSQPFLKDLEDKSNEKVTSQKYDFIPRRAKAVLDLYNTIKQNI